MTKIEINFFTSVYVDKLYREVISTQNYSNYLKDVFLFEQEIAKALQSNGRKDLLFALTHEYEMYLVLQSKISECDKQIETMLKN